MATAIKIPTIFTAVDKFSSVVDKMSRSTDNFAGRGAKNLARMERSVRSLTPSFSGLNNALGGFGGLIAGFGAIELGKSAFKSVTDFETGLVGVAKTTGISGDKLKILGNSIIDTSDSLKTVSSQKLLELAQVAGQLGISSNKDILNFSTTLAKLEQASDIQGEEGASSIARLLTITGEGPGVVDKFASALVGLGNTSAATEGEILGVASEVARSTAAYKLQSQEILGISATLKSLDVRPEAAGTAVGKVFREIEQATIKGGKSLNDFGKVMGLTPIQVKETFEKTPTKAFSLFIKGLNKISNEGGSVTKTMDDLGLSGEIVAKGIIPLATNYDLLNEKLKKSSVEFEANNALNEEFNASQKTISNSLSAVVNSWDNLLIKQATAGDGLSTIQNILLFVANNMDKIVITLATLGGLYLSTNIALKAWRLGLILINVAQGVNNFLLGQGMIALRGSTIAMNAYQVAAKIAAANQWLLNSALGIGLLPLIAIGAAVAVVIAYWDEFGAALALVGGIVAIFFAPLLAALAFTISLVQSFRRNWDAIGEAFASGNIVDGFLLIGATILDAILMPLQQVFQLMTNLPGVGEFAQDAVDGIEKFRANMGLNVTTDESGESLVNPKATEAEVAKSREESKNRPQGNGVLRIENQTGNNASFTGKIPGLDILTTSTQGF